MGSGALCVPGGNRVHDHSSLDNGSGSNIDNDNDADNNSFVGDNESDDLTESGRTSHASLSPTYSATLSSGSLSSVLEDDTESFEGGVLEVIIVSATGVKKMDLVGKSDVYAVVTFGLEEVRTSVKENTDRCEWGDNGEGEWVWFFVPSTATKNLEVRLSLWDEDTAVLQDPKAMFNRGRASGIADDFIGSAVVKFGSIDDGFKLKRRGTLTRGGLQSTMVFDKEGNPTGTLYYRVRMLEQSEEIGGTFWKTLLRVVDVDGDAETVSKEDATALMTFLEVSPEATNIFFPEIEITDLSLGDISNMYYVVEGNTIYGENPIYSINGMGTIPIQQTVVNLYGCEDTITKTVYVEPNDLLYVPNSFTPNGDGSNDFFKPVTFGLEEYQFYIYNRWGSIIYEGNESSIGWDGMVNNKPVQDGAYVWQIKYRDHLNKRYEKRGHVVIYK